MFRSLFFALFWHLWLCWRASYFISDHLLLKNLLRTLIFYQILSTQSLRKYIEISLENLYVDIETKRVKEEAMLMLVLCYCICTFLCGRHSFNPSLCRLSPLPLSHVTVSRPCPCQNFTLTGPWIRLTKVHSVDLLPLNPYLFILFIHLFIYFRTRWWPQFAL